MAIQDQITNHTEEVDGEVRVFCANCGDPDGGEVNFTDAEGNVLRTETHPPTGYTEANKLLSLGWKRIGEQLVCGDPRCGAALTGEDPNPVLAAMAVDEAMTPDQVAAMTPVGTVEIETVDDLPDFQEFAAANRVENTDEEQENAKVETDNT